MGSTNVYKSFISVQEFSGLAHWFAGWVYANVIIHLSVGESQVYSPPLRWIITQYSLPLLRNHAQCVSFTGLTILTVSVVKVIFSFFRYLYNHTQCLFPIILSGPQDIVRFGKRPMARQNSGRHTLRMIVKGAYCYSCVFLLSYYSWYYYFISFVKPVCIIFFLAALS